MQCGSSGGGPCGGHHVTAYPLGSAHSGAVVNADKPSRTRPPRDRIGHVCFLGLPSRSFSRMHQVPGRRSAASGPLEFGLCQALCLGGVALVVVTPSRVGSLWCSRPLWRGTPKKKMAALQLPGAAAESAATTAAQLPHHPLGLYYGFGGQCLRLRPPWFAVAPWYPAPMSRRPVGECLRDLHSAHSPSFGAA